MAAEPQLPGVQQHAQQPPDPSLPGPQDDLVATVAAEYGIPYAEAEARVARATTPRDLYGRPCNRRCPHCDANVHADRRGDWACHRCGAAGGTFAGERMYLTRRPVAAP